MAKTLHDFSQLKFSMLKASTPVEVKRESPIVDRDDGAEVLAYFSKAFAQKLEAKVAVSNVQVDEGVDALKAKLKAKDEILSELTADKVAAEERVMGLETKVRELEEALSIANEAISRLKARCTQLQQEAQKNFDKVETYDPQRPDDKMVGEKKNSHKSFLCLSPMSRRSFQVSFGKWLLRHYWNLKAMPSNLGASVARFFCPRFLRGMSCRVSLNGGGVGSGKF
jgi:hypothetical protein